MERWAQSQNKKKVETVKKPSATTAQVSTIKPAAVVATLATSHSEVKAKEENGGFVQKKETEMITEEKQIFLKVTVLRSLKRRFISYIKILM